MQFIDKRSFFGHFRSPPSSDAAYVCATLISARVAIAADLAMPIKLDSPADADISLNADERARPVMISPRRLLYAERSSAASRLLPHMPTAPGVTLAK